jgi:DNA-binding winged helix-turn-helix (wHTH) protein/tetratricopeptide (TPR) repeat protein
MSKSVPQLKGDSERWYSFGEFRLNLTRASLERNGLEVRLRPKSFDTLRYLVENAGRLITKKEMIEMLWPDSFVSDESLAQCLKDVRRALDDNERRYIRTVQRRGYIFDADVIDSLQPNAKTRIRSIAVLPFKPLVADESDKYLGLAMADTLITKLGSLGEIIVRPTSAIQGYMSTDQDTLSAGREQRVDAALEGSIQRSSDKLRVTVRLMKVLDGATLWTYKCDEYCADMFATEDAITERLAEALSIGLTGEKRQRLAKRYTENAEAQQLYIKGVFFRNQMTEKGLKKSVEYFQKAIELDASYALAYAGQASSNSPLAYLGYIPVAEAEFTNRRLIMKALELDNTLAEAHAALAEFKLFIEWDWEGAENEFKRALELNPSEQLTNLLYPDLLLIKGRFEEAITFSKSALEDDPISPRAGKGLAWVYFHAGQYDESLQQFKKTRELFPTYAEINLGPSYEAKGMYEQAVKEYLDAESRSGMPAEEMTALSQAYAASGWGGYWQKRLELMEAQAQQTPVPPTNLAELYARVGENARALDWLERAYEKRDMSLVLLSVDPKWKSLRSEPRFRDLLHRLRLAD